MSRGLSALCAVLAAGCASRAVPDPRAAVRVYVEAAAHGDADSLYTMMTRASQQSMSREAAARKIADEREELADQARELGRSDVRLEATARLRYADGEEVALDLRDGQYGVTSAGAFPFGAKTPEEALDQLRRVLARRSYAGLMRVLSPATRAAVEGDMRTLVDGLTRPETLPLQVSGDAALVAIPGGHQVKLKRASGIWRVDDFD